MHRDLQAPTIQKKYRVMWEKNSLYTADAWKVEKIFIMRVIGKSG